MDAEVVVVETEHLAFPLDAADVVAEDPVRSQHLDVREGRRFVQDSQDGSLAAQELLPAR